jgi:23S rRNA (cytosine1962-C5)-methyltransferase
MAIAYLRGGREKKVLQGNPWVFSSEIDRISGTYAPGEVVSVKSARGRMLGCAFYNPQSQIALRFVTFRDEHVNEEFFRQRIHRAVAYRSAFADMKSCRMVFAESDGLPALIVDSFGGVLSMQCLCLGMEKHRETILKALCEELDPQGIWQRDDVPVRELEGLEQKTGLLYGEVPDKVEISENGVRFLVDVKNGQKTGFFLDQKENRAAIAPFVKNAKVLDCFTHTGSFALHAAYYGAADVTGVDISEYACECAAENARLNGLDNVHFVAANAFDLLKEKQTAGEKYDVVILDPPAFTKTRGAVESALRGYKEINLRAMKLLRDGGYLVTCSCSQHILPPLFQKMVQEAAEDTHTRLMQVEFRTQGRDHPILPALPETQYLKCGIYRIER